MKQQHAETRRAVGQAQGLYGRVKRQIKRGVVAFIRQSSRYQKIYCTGSQRAQRSQLRHLQPFGVRRKDVTVIKATESASPNKIRRKFRQLEQLIASGKVGLVLLARHDRLSRDEEAAVRIYRLMAEMGVLLMVDGRLYDPADENDDFVLSIYAKFAEYENRARTRWIMMSRFAKAQRLEERVTLPTGLIWANPTDPVFLARAESTNIPEIMQWIGEAAQTHLAKSARGPKTTYYVLPYPDAEVYHSCRLRMQWMLETNDLYEVLRRIRHDPAWPAGRHGTVPVVPGGRFHPRRKPKWRRATVERVWSWFRSPALYGTYSYSAYALARRYARASMGPPAQSVDGDSQSDPSAHEEGL